LRARGEKAWAVKPFCSGGRGDAELLCALQDGELNLAEVNPFYFPEPVAPLISSRRHRRRVELAEAVEFVKSTAARLERGKAAGSRGPKGDSWLLVEGSGGLLVPLGEGYTVLDLMVGLCCEVVLVSRNQLGTVNHTMLTLRELQRAGFRPANKGPGGGRTARAAQARAGKLRCVALMNSGKKDFSMASNGRLLAELGAPAAVVPIAFLGPVCKGATQVRAAARKLEKVLRKIV
jgi:dethiobiotin synthase